jgi:hypothetical protein
MDVDILGESVQTSCWQDIMGRLGGEQKAAMRAEGAAVCDWGG